MTQAERRIRNLKLYGRNNDDLLKARYLLEEAFRTASLPGLPPNAMVLVRRLDLGKIRAGVSVVQVADTISETVRALAAQAVCIDQQPANDASVVWLSDALQPYRVLLQRLLDGKLADEWYWQSLFPEQDLNLNEQLLTQLLIKACQTPLKGLAVSLVIQSCLAPVRLSRLLAFVTPALARRILHAQGISPFSLPATETQATFSAEIKAMQPIAAPNLSLAWRNAINSVVARWGEEDERSGWLAWQGLVCHQPAWLERSNTLQRIDVSEWLQAWSRGRDFHNSRNVAGDEIPPNPPFAKGGMGEEFIYREASDEVGAGVRVATLSPPPLQRGAGGDLPGDEQVSSNSDENIAQSLASNTELSVSFTQHAGFAFVIPLLQRIGISELLGNHERLLELDFPRQLLWMMAKRFAVVENDPVYSLFENFQPIVNVPLEDIQLPAIWTGMTTRSGRPLSPASTASLNDLINTTQLLAGLYLRRHCALSLHGLIQRPGRVALSHTHWDVMFDINQTDLRLRRLALDSDPGWVPWLGRVVQFHYDSEG